MNCLECPKRETCAELCPEAEAYVDQDRQTFPGNIYLRDQTAPDPAEMLATIEGDIRVTAWPDLMGEIPSLGQEDISLACDETGLTDLQRRIMLAYYHAEETLADIGREMKVNVSTIHRHLARARRKVIFKLWATFRLKALKGEKLTWTQRRIEQMPAKDVMERYAPIKGRGQAGRPKKQNALFVTM